MNTLKSDHELSQRNIPYKLANILQVWELRTRFSAENNFCECVARYAIASFAKIRIANVDQVILQYISLNAQSFRKKCVVECDAWCLDRKKCVWPRKERKPCSVDERIARLCANSIYTIVRERQKRANERGLHCSMSRSRFFSRTFWRRHAFLLIRINISKPNLIILTHWVFGASSKLELFVKRHAAAFEVTKETN